MRHRRRSDPQGDAEEDEEDGEIDDEEPPRGRPVPRRAGIPHPHRPIQPWSPDGGVPEVGWLGRTKRPVFWRARDSLWFEPVVAVMIVFLLLVSLWAYTDNWPPVYVVESSSMQHGPSDVLGLLNTGDLLLAQKTDASRVIPYEVGSQTGYTTYGEYGDVVLYYPNGQTGISPIIHRAILYLEWSPQTNSFNLTELASLTCTFSNHPFYRTWSTLGGCGTTGVSGNLSLYGIGWRSANLTVTLSTLGTHSGFLTMGDNNLAAGASAVGEPDQPTLSSLVEPAWMIGVARGMIPWFGSLKLLLQGDSAMVPAQSWQYLGATLAALVLGGLGLHLALRRVEERRELAEDENDEESGSDEEADQPGLLARLRQRLSREEAEEEDEELDEPPERPHHTRRVRIDARHLARTGGRPRPKTRREPRSNSHPDSGNQHGAHAKKPHHQRD